MENSPKFTTFPNGGLKEPPQTQIEGEDDKEDKISATNKRKKIQFQASHTLLIGFFFWILYVNRHQSPPAITKLMSPALFMHLVSISSPRASF